MKRILVIGCCGSGKSTLSHKLYSKLGLPIIHLDQVYWQTDWIETHKAEFEKKVKELANQPAYIMDGNYASTLDLRLQRADTLIYLDFPTWICLWRVLKRIFKYHGQTRPDMTPGCHERFDIGFLHYVITFRWIAAPRIENILGKGDYLTNIVRLKNDKSVQAYLDSL